MIHEATETCLQCWRPTPLSVLSLADMCPDCDLRAARIRWASSDRLPAKHPEVKAARDGLVRREWPSATD